MRSGEQGQASPRGRLYFPVVLASSSLLLLFLTSLFLYFLDMCS